MMSSMFVAMNRPIACRTEDRIMRPPPRYSRPGDPAVPAAACR